MFHILFQRCQSESNYSVINYEIKLGIKGYEERNEIWTEAEKSEKRETEEGREGDILTT